MSDNDFNEYDKDIFQFIYDNRDLINEIATTLGLASNHMIAAPIMDEFTLSENFERGYGALDSLQNAQVKILINLVNLDYAAGAFGADLSASERIEEEYNQHYTEHVDGDVIYVTQNIENIWTNKLQVIVMNDVGDANIEIATAIALIKTYALQYPDSDPLDFKKYVGNWDELALDLASNNPEAVVGITGLMSLEASNYFNQHMGADRWDALSKEDKTALTTTYFKFGRGLIDEKRLTAKQAWEEDPNNNGETFVYEPGHDGVGGGVYHKDKDSVESALTEDPNSLEPLIKAFEEHFDAMAGFIVNMTRGDSVNSVTPVENLTDFEEKYGDALVQNLDVLELGNASYSVRSTDINGIHSFVLEFRFDGKSEPYSITFMGTDGDYETFSQGLVNLSNAGVPESLQPYVMQEVANDPSLLALLGSGNFDDLPPEIEAIVEKVETKVGSLIEGDPDLFEKAFPEGIHIELFADIPNLNGGTSSERGSKTKTEIKTTFAPDNGGLSNGMRLVETYAYYKEGTTVYKDLISRDILIGDTRVSVGALGSAFGSSLYNALDRDAGVMERAVLSTIAGVVGKNLFQTAGFVVGGESIHEAAENAFFDIGYDLKGAAIGAVSGLLASQLIGELGLDDLEGGIAQTITNSAMSTLFTNATDGLESTKLFDNFSGNVTNAFATYVGTMLAKEVISFNSIGGQVGSSVGSVAGSAYVSGLLTSAAAAGTVSTTVAGVTTYSLSASATTFQAFAYNLGITAGPLGMAIGAFAGYILGGILGSAFGGTPRSAADVTWDETSQRFSLSASWSKKGGSKAAAENIANTAAQLLNSTLFTIGGELMNGGSIQAGTYGVRPTNLTYRYSASTTKGKEDVDVKFALGDTEGLINFGVFHAFSSMEIAGGDIFVKRAFYNNLELSGDANGFDTFALVGDLAIAGSYSFYQDNSLMIDFLLSEGPDSTFAASWIATFARAHELGLNKRNGSDWYGGWEHFVESKDTTVGATALYYQQASGGKAGSREMFYADSNGAFQIQHDTVLAHEKDHIQLTSGNDVLDMSTRASTDTVGVVDVISDVRGFTINGEAITGDTAVELQIDIAAEVHGGAGDDIITGGDMGNDLFGDAGHDTITGGAKDDWIFGGDGNDTLNAGGGNGNFLSGDAGHDTLRGGAGSDWLEGGVGVDDLRGAGGDDVLAGGATSGDFMAGGSGNDQYIFRLGDGVDTLSDKAEGNVQKLDISQNVISMDLGVIERNWAGGGQYTEGEGTDALGGTDALVLGAGITLDMVKLRRNGNDLILTLMDENGNNTGDQLTMTSWFDALNRIEILRFADGEEFRIGAVENFVTGTDGDDYIIGTYQADFIVGGKGNDTILALAGDDFGAGGAGDDLISGGADNDLISGGIGDDILIGDAGRDVLEGGSGSDILWGETGNDRLVGAHGNDILIGGTGDDSFHFARGDGHDTVIDQVSGAGATTIWTSSGGLATGVSIDDDGVFTLSDGTIVYDGDKWVGLVSYDESSVKVYDINSTTDSGVDTLEFAIGIDPGDIYMKWVGDDLILGISPNGSETANFEDMTDTITLKNWANSGGTIDNAIEKFLFFNVGNLDVNDINVWGGGTDGDDLINGSTGKDWLTGNAGDDVISGLAGDDILAGHGGNDELIGGGGDDVLLGGGNDDILEGGRGADELIGGSGHDIISYANSTNGVEVHLDTGLAAGGDASGDRFEEVEGVTGSGYSDKLFGDGGANTIEGGAGNDMLAGGTGDDDYVYNLGDGNDTIWDANLTYQEPKSGQGGSGVGSDGGEFPGNGSGTSNPNSRWYQNSDEPMFMALSAESYASFDTTTTINDTADIANYKANGNEAGLNDSISFGEGIALSDLTFAMSGNDLIITINKANGGALTIRDFGNSVNSIEKLIFSDGSEVSVADYRATGVATSLGDFLAGSSSANTLKGLGGNDSLSGYAGNDILIGGAGDDFLSGGAGADSIQGGEGNDTATYLGSTSGVSINLQNGTASGGHASGDVLSSIENLRGSNFNDILIGNGEANILRGGLGSDWITGAGGDDTLNGGLGNDTVSGGAGTDNITGDDGNDTLSGGSGDDTIFAGNDDDILKGDAGDDALNGGAGADLIEGGTGSDTLYGGSGNDWLLGGVDNDTLEGGVGTDTLEGGSGDDKYSFGNDDGVDTIKDSQGQNIAQFMGLNPDQLWFSKNGDDLVVEVIGSDSKVTIDGYYSHDRSAFRIQAGTYLLYAKFIDPLVDAMALVAKPSSPADFPESVTDLLPFHWHPEGNADPEDKIINLGDGNGSLDQNDTVTIDLAVVDHDENITDYEVISGVTKGLLTHLGNGVFSFNGNPEDYGEDHFTVRITDAGGNDALIEVNLDIRHTNDNPTDIYLEGTDVDHPDDVVVDENKAPVLVGYLDSADDAVLEEQDAASFTHTYEVSGGEDGDMFEIRGNELWLMATANFEEKDLLTLEITTTDEGELSFTRELTVNVLDVNETPTKIIINGDEPLIPAPENTANVIIGSVVALDPDTGVGNDFADHIFSVNDSRFEIVDGILKLGKIAVGEDGDGNIIYQDATIDYETEETITLEITVTDRNGNGQSLTSSITVEVEDLIDIIHGTDVTEILKGAQGEDWIYAKDGDDTVEAGAGNDLVYGGLGSDLLYGGDGNDELRGELGNDNLYGEAGDDHLIASQGDDQLEGGDGSDILEGGSGKDTLKGGAGNDTLNAGIGDDTLMGGTGDDILNGQEGDDYIHGDVGSDTIDGGAGFDTIDYSSSSSAITLNLQNGTGQGGDAEGDSLSGIEKVIASQHSDNITGSTSSDVIYGQAGDDSIEASGGDDKLYGQAGTDQLAGNDGNDLLSGGDGDDTLEGGAGNDDLYGDAGADVITGGAGDDALYGGAGNDVLKGGAGDDVYVVGLSGDDDTIINEGSAGDWDVVRYTDGIVYEQLWFEQTGDDLVVTVIEGGTSITIKDWFLANDADSTDFYRVDLFVAGEWVSREIKVDTMIDLMKDTARPETIAELQTFLDSDPDGNGLNKSEELADLWDLNESPVINAISNQSTDEDISKDVTITVTDAETDISHIEIKIGSDDTLVLNPEDVVIGEPDGDGNRVVTFKPISDAFGDAVITVTAIDGNEAESVQSFTLTVNPINDAPVLEAEDTISINENSKGQIAVSLKDVDTSLSDISISIISDNGDLVDASSFTWTGTDADRKLHITPNENINGTANITITANDGQGGVTTHKVKVDVAPVNTAPIITAPTLAGNTVTTYEDDGWTDVDINFNDVETSSDDLVINVAVSNIQMVVNGEDISSQVTTNGSGVLIDQNVTTTIVNNGDGTYNVVATDLSSNATEVIASFRIVGSGDDRKLQFRTTENAYGDFNFIITAKDGGDQYDPNSADVQTGNRSPLIGALTVKVVTKGVNDAPTVTDISTTTINEDAGKKTVSFSIDDEETLPGSLTVTATSSNTALIANGSIKINGTGANRSVSFTPTANAFGTSFITLNVSDGEIVTEEKFKVIVNSVNDKPTISAISNQSATEGTKKSGISFKVTDIEDSNGTLSISVKSSNYSVVKPGNFSISKSGSNRYLSFTPIGAGTANITVTVTDSDGGTSSEAFTITSAKAQTSPEFSSSSATFSVSENSGLNFVVGTVAATDEDGDSLKYRIKSGNTGGAFSVDSSGRIKVLGNLNYEATSSYNLTVQVSDDGGAYWDDSIAVKVNIGNINEPPVSSNTSFDRVATVYRNTVVGSVNASDPEGGSLSYSISNITTDVAGHSYTVDSYGRVRLTDTITATAVANYGDMYDSIKVKVTDSSGNYTYSTVNVHYTQNTIIWSPVVLDLDGDGVELVSLAESKVYFDIDEDGDREKTGWAGADDALLALDRDGNGEINGMSEISFVDDLPGATTDVEGLRAFDTNENGLLDEGDERFSEFLIWQDKNQNGHSEKNELISLLDAGITYIDLTISPTGNSVEDAVDNVITGTVDYGNDEGSLGVAGDVTFFYDNDDGKGGRAAKPVKYEKPDPIAEAKNNVAEELIKWFEKENSVNSNEGGTGEGFGKNIGGFNAINLENLTSTYNYNENQSARDIEKSVDPEETYLLDNSIEFEIGENIDLEGLESLDLTTILDFITKNTNDSTLTNSDSFDVPETSSDPDENSVNLVKLVEVMASFSNDNANSELPVEIIDLLGSDNPALIAKKGTRSEALEEIIFG